MIMFSRLVSPSYRSLILGLVASLAALANLTGCASWSALDSADQYGRTYYILDSHKFSLTASSSETGVFLQQFHVQGSHFLDDLKQRFVVG